MNSISVAPLADDLPFGARISGMSWDNVRDEKVHARIRDVFEDRGMIVFEGVEPSSEFQVALSDIIGPLQDHALKSLQRVDQKSMPGVVELNTEGGLFEMDGKEVVGWTSWHYDASYSNRLNRGGVLRAIEIPEHGGQTGYADGIQIYKAIDPDLRARFEDVKIVYDQKNLMHRQRFGLPAGVKFLKVPESVMKVLEFAEGEPRAVHPAIWTRSTGEKVLHISPWQMAGIEGNETAEGDALLEDLCHEVYAKMQPYYHEWKPTDMIVWDNWRMIHSVNPHLPQEVRCVHRTTILGDYGLGRFEHEGQVA